MDISPDSTSAGKPGPHDEPGVTRYLQEVPAGGQEDVSLVSQQPSSETRRYSPPRVERSRVVQKPLTRTQADDPRGFQLQQLRRRFSPKESISDGFTVLTFDLNPSDPDFPYDINALECVLRVPLDYPAQRKPQLKVSNKEMERGYQINVERGFDTLAEQASHPTLLGLMNALDKNLETLLSLPKADTVKLISNLDSSELTRQPPATMEPPTVAKPALVPRAVTSSSVAPNLRPTFSPGQKEQANHIRNGELRQLEARLGRLPLYSKVSENAYLIPIEPRKRNELPVPLQGVKTVKLFVPTLYNLEPCTLQLVGIDPSVAKKTEKAFEERARSNPEISILGHINYLSQSMHIMATEPDIPEVLPSPKAAKAPESVVAEFPSQAVEPLPKDGEILHDRSHIKFIARPPEWTAGETNAEETDSEYSSWGSGDDSEDEVSDEASETRPEKTTKAAERGILLSFPYLELYGIELLELFSLSITIKCERCKDCMDVPNLKDNVKHDTSGLRSESCKKCANGLSIGDFTHLLFTVKEKFSKSF
ncbi:MAG: hypothetical protein M1819_001784 [Sarea resinae]|nr:MAG: hypothetical protein M1819_001784 [Sarea resinae]